MRASPAFRICIRRYGVWRTAVAGLLAVTFAVQAAWLAARLDDAPPVVSIGLVLLDLLLLAAAAGAWRTAPLELHWDTRHWRLGPSDSRAIEAPAGDLCVALDLGVWMLLRFDRQGGPRRGRRTWLPVQRRGLEADWHALRCAVYCAGPAVGTEAGQNLRAGAESQE